MRNLTPEQVERLALLEQDGKLTPQDVVDDATPDGSVLHPLFEWDHKTAADAYRLAQAREVIRYVWTMVTTTKRLVHVTKYVRDPDVGQQQGYRNIATVKNPDEQRRIVLAEARRALGLMRRCAEIAAALDMDDGAIEAIDLWSAWHMELAGTVPAVV